MVLRSKPGQSEVGGYTLKGLPREAGWQMMRWVAPLATVVAVLAAGLWFWWPPGENHNRYSDLGTTLIGGAIVGVAVLYVERQLTRGVERRDLQLQLGLTDAIPGID